MTEDADKIGAKLLPYWVITCKKKLVTSITILKTQPEVLRMQKKYEKDGYICQIEKKS